MTNIIINELLCYIANKVNILATTFLEKLCVDAFTADQIESSKLVFFNACKRGPDDEVIPDVFWFKLRRGALKSVNNIKDIIALFLELGNEVPTFVAADLNSLPPLTIDSIDVSALLVSMERLKADVSALNIAMNEQQSNVSTLSTTVENIANRPPSVVNQPIARFADIMASQETTEIRNINTNNGITDDNRPKKDDRRRFRKSKFVTGKSTAVQAMNGVKKPNKVHVFVTRLPSSCTEADVTKLVRDNLQKEAVAEKLVTTHDAHFSSFHVSCICDELEILLDPMLWPQDCLFRKWYPPRKRPVSSQAHSGSAPSGGGFSGTS